MMTSVNSLEYFRKSAEHHERQNARSYKQNAPDYNCHPCVRSHNLASL